MCGVGSHRALRRIGDCVGSAPMVIPQRRFRNKCQRSQVDRLTSRIARWRATSRRPALGTPPIVLTWLG